MRNSFSRWCLLALLIVPLVSSTAWAQTFTGGLRGVVSDSGGVVPGVTVTLTNESTGATREAVSNEEGAVQLRGGGPRRLHGQGGVDGIQDLRAKGVRVGAQQFLTVDVKLDVGQLQETITVTGEAPLIDTSTASTGAVIDTEQLNTLPSGGRSAFLFAVTVPTVIASGDSQFNRQQDQTNASLAVARRRHAPRQQLPRRRRAGHRPAQPRVGQPQHRGARRRQRAGAHLRRRDRPHRRRHLQYRHEVRRQLLARQRLLPGPSAMGHGQQLLHGTGGRPAARDLLPPRWRRRRRPDDQEPHVLLGVGRRLRVEHHEERVHPVPDRARAHRRFLAVLRQRRPAGRDLRSADGRRQRQRPHPVPRQRHPAKPHQPGRAEPGQHLSESRPATSATRSATSTAPRRSKTAR